MGIYRALITAAGTIIAAIIGYFSYKKKRIQNKFGEKKLKHHSAHLRIKDFKEYINYGIGAESSGRENIVKDFLLQMLDIYQTKLEEISETVDNKDLTNEELKKLNLEKLHEGIDERSTYFYCDEYTEEEREALELLVKKYQTKQKNRINHLKDSIKKAVDNKYYNDQITMQALIFDKCVGEFAHILTWFEDIIDDINGDFDNLKFKGESLNKKPSSDD